MLRTLVQARFRRDRTIRVGELELQDMFAAPPVRPHTWASLAMITHKDILEVAMNVDLNRVGRDHASRFLKTYCDRLEETADRSE